MVHDHQGIAAVGQVVKVRELKVFVLGDVHVVGSCVDGRGGAVRIALHQVRVVGTHCLSVFVIRLHHRGDAELDFGILAEQHRIRVRAVQREKRHERNHYEHNGSTGHDERGLYLGLGGGGRVVRAGRSSWGVRAGGDIRAGRDSRSVRCTRIRAGIGWTGHGDGRVHGLHGSCLLSGGLSDGIRDFSRRIVLALRALRHGLGVFGHGQRRRLRSIGRALYRLAARCAELGVVSQLVAAVGAIHDRSFPQR